MAVKWVAVVLFLTSAAMAGCSAEQGRGQFAVTSAVNSMVATKSQATDAVPGEETKSARHVIREGDLSTSTVPDSRVAAGIRVEKGVWNFGGIKKHYENLMPESSRHLFQPIWDSRTTGTTEKRVCER